jgi:hypothetical protein
MSMNFSEFKKLIGADPWNRGSETLRARNSAPEFEEAASEAELFEQKLQSALNVQAPADLLESIKGISQQSPERRNWMPLALAASVIIAVGAAGVAWKQSHEWESVEAYVADHYSHDGPGLVAKATNVVDERDINEIMAGLDASLGQQLSANVKFIKHCPTPDGRGVHMVLNTEQGPMTVIFMPKTSVTDGELVTFDQMQALMVSLEHGSVAIIGTQSQDFGGLEAVIKQSLRTGLVGA